MVVAYLEYEGEKDRRKRNHHNIYRKKKLGTCREPNLKLET